VIVFLKHGPGQFDVRNVVLCCGPVDRCHVCVDVEYLAVAVRCSNYDVVGLCAANAAQNEAVKHALIHSFSLIQTPPGTGKILTTVRLAALFVRINHSLPAEYERAKVRPQLLLCGPTNQSVDVIASELQ